MRRRARSLNESDCVSDSNAGSPGCRSFSRGGAVVAFFSLQVRAATFITARLGSTRLPRKMLLELHGQTALERLIDRLRLAQRPDLLVVCTTTEREDDELAALAARLGAEAFRGDRDDILVRWLGATDEHDVDFFAACDGDDLFCDPIHVDRLIACHEETGAEYITCVGLPFGAAPIGIART